MTNPSTTSPCTTTQNNKATKRCIGDDSVTSRNSDDAKISTEKSVWVRLNKKGIHHDNRRLLKHRAKNCECFVCYREIFKLPPAETHDEYVQSLRIKIKERETKRTKRMAKKDVKAGKQTTIKQYF
jgi:hypothetical protein